MGGAVVFQDRDMSVMRSAASDACRWNKLVVGSDDDDDAAADDDDEYVIKYETKQRGVKIQKGTAGGEELTQRRSGCRCGCGCGLRGGDDNMEGVETLSA